jgi:hypothetical protein
MHLLDKFFVVVLAACRAGLQGSQQRLCETLPRVCCLLRVADVLPVVLPQLFLGDTNRTISETPMNQASSRSHCIFTIMLEARQAGSDIVRRSKLHLVDLAGSERVAKSGDWRAHAWQCCRVHAS